MSYEATRSRVATYFDETATGRWARLTSNAPVSRIRETVRQGRAEMQAVLLSNLPDDLRDARVLDAGCGTGLMSAALAARGAEVLAVDISPQLIDIAKARCAPEHAKRIRFLAGDMLAPNYGRFDYTLAMDSLIYYNFNDLRHAVDVLLRQSGHSLLFTVAPKTPLLTAMFWVGKAFPRADRSPRMVPQAPKRLSRALGGRQLERVSRGFYISEAIQVPT